MFLLINSMLVVTLSLLSYCVATDPCQTSNIINDWKRSAGYVTTVSDNICDSVLIEQWYRITGNAGERMPTKCIDGGHRCGTSMPYWLTNTSVPADEDIFPKKNTTVTRTACSSHYSGDCCRYNITIQIKNCTNFLVYYLKPTSPCSTGYCFGKEVQCPSNQYSENGFTPGCASYPNETIQPKPKVSTGLYPFYTERTVIQTVIFQCNANIDTKYTIDVHWYINGEEVVSACYNNIAADDIHRALLHQDHWDKKYKPNMNVSCSIQLRQTVFKAPSPTQFSDDFFAGLVVDYKEAQVLTENDLPKNISARLTIPVGCSYPDSGSLMLHVQKLCVVNLLGAVPDYQGGDQCIHGQVRNGVNFHPVKCGLYFNYTHWNHSQTISVSAMSDERVNVEPRILYLRLYVDAIRVWTNIKELEFWRGFINPDLKFLILDSDYTTYDAVCSSDNSIHITTFDKTYYSFHRTEGEYILYKHSNLPVEVIRNGKIHAYYQKCNGRALCNCGAAIRSGKSIFIVNFCRINVRQNRYAIQKICDVQDMKVTGSPSNYKISIMSGTKITMSFGLVPGDDFYGIRTFQIQASNLDKSQTSGLCGSLNGKGQDDLIPKGGYLPVSDPEYFAESWRLKAGQETDSLFDINNIKHLDEYAKPYCTCKKDADKFPYGEPHFSCNYTESIDTCSRLKLENKVYKAPCKRDTFRTKRDTLSVRQTTLVRKKRAAEIPNKLSGEIIELSDDDAPVMYPMNISDGRSETPDLSWKNSWTEDKARQHCKDAFQSSMSFSACDQHIKAVPSDNYIDKCVKDIQLTGESHWDTVSVNNYATACLQVATKLENLTKVNETSSSGEEVSIFDLIQKATCPKNCSGKGICTNGQCECIDPYFGPACEVEKSQAPKLSPRAFNGLCDTSFKPCHKYIIPGLNFVEGGLKCRYKQFTIHLNETKKTNLIETADGIYNNPFSMQCPVPSSRHKRSANEKASAIGYFISVSNDGKNFTEDLTVIIYDSMCYECSTSNLTCTEVDTCPRVKVITKEKYNTWAYIGAALGGAVLVIIGLVVLIYVKKKILKGRSSIKDTSASFHEKERNTQVFSDETFVTKIK